MSMRGGARVCGGDMYNPDYNAMEDDYNNCDGNSSGGAQGRKKGSDDVVTLHVSNIPTSLTEKGLIHIFASDGGNPLRAYIGKVNNSVYAQPGTTWGFVDFKTLSEAQAAISALNRKPPHNLNVKFSRSEEQKLQKDRSINDDRDSDSDRNSITPMTRGRGQLPPMKGKSPSNFRSTRVQDEPFYDSYSSKQQDYSNNLFSHPDSSYELTASNAVHSPFAEGYYDDGRRKMTMGRGAFINAVDSHNKAPPSTPSSISREKYAIEDVTDEMDTKVAAYISKRFKELSCDENLKLSTEMKLSLPFKLGQCVYCYRPSIYCCSRCKEWYCCNSCRVDDYPSHRKTCSPRSIIFDKNGHISYSNEPDEFVDAEETPVMTKPRDNGPTSYERSSRSIQDRSPRNASQFENKHKGDSPGFHETNGYENNSYERNGEQGYRSNERNQYRDNQRDFPGDQQRGSNDRNQYRDNQRDSLGEQNKGARGSRDNNRGGRTSRGGGSGRNDRRSAGGRGNQDLQNDVYVRPPVSPPGSTVGHSEDKKKVPPSPLMNSPEPPIPLNAFTEVTIGSLGQQKNEFFAYSQFEYKNQSEMMKTLTDLSAKSSPISERIEIGTKVCAPFSELWFRAEVKKFVQSKVEVFFIDFGNTAVIEKKELRPLPPNLAAKPPMAFKYVLAECLDNPELTEELAFKLKPIKQDREGRWIVQIEGYSYEGLQEVTVLVTENPGEYWVYKSSDRLLLYEMASQLGEHKEKNVEPVIGDIYVHYFNYSWCRAKVVSLNPLKVFYVDYGNYNCVQEHELHPVPNKYVTVPPLALKIKLTEGSPKACYNLSECSVLIIMPVNKFFSGRARRRVWLTSDLKVQLDDGTLLCDGVTNQSGSGDVAAKAAPKHLLFNLDKSKAPKLYIEKIMNEDFLTGCILPEEGSIPFKEISKILKKEVIISDTIGLNRGMMVAALWDGDWHRGYVMLIRGEDPIVALTDRGRVIIPQAVAPLPENISRIPESGFRAILREPIKNMNISGKTLSLKNVRLEEDKVRVEVEEFGEAVLVPWEPSVEEAGLSSIQLASGTKVVISAYVSPTAVYLQSNRPQDLTLRAEIVQDIAAHCLKCEPLKRKPLSGEFLAARFAEDDNYYRAQIFRKQGNKYKVTFVDYGNTEVVSISDMKPLPDSLKCIPCCAVKVGLKGVPDVPFNTQCMRYLNELSANLMELFLTFDGGDLRNVTLTLRDGEVVNKVLIDLLTPSWDKPDFSPFKGPVFMESDLIYEDWRKGEKFQIATVRVVGPDEIIVLRTSSDLLNHIESNLTPRITKYCEQFPKEMYNPRQNEVCLAKFHEDENWYRAVCIKSYIHNAAEVFYVDYGNSGEVLHRCIRKMVPEFMESPVALKICRVYGFTTEKLPKEAEKRLTNFYSSQRHEAVVIDDKSARPVIWIPALQDFAKELGFSLKSP